MSNNKELPGNIPLNLSEYLRILKLTRKPTKQEFNTIAKVAGAGILVIGFIGFVIFLLIIELPKWLS